MSSVVTDPPDTAAGWVPRLYRANLSTGRATLAEMFGGHVEVASQGSWLQTSDGRRLLNVGGYGVFLMGARHPTVIRAVERQLHTHPVASRLFLEPTLAIAAKTLIGVCPPGLERLHFSGSGAEAVEAGIKMARAAGRRHIVTMTSGYHGKTMGALSATANNVYQTPFRPLLPDVTHVPYGDAGALAAVLAELGAKACVIVEPVQGEAGVRIPPDGYLSQVSALCRQHGAFLILDEIQTGLGRLGSWWGADREGIRPDILLAGKGLSGGVVPVAATVATPEAFGVFDRDPFLHTSTFSGAPLAMAAVTGAVTAIREDGLVTRAESLGRRLLPELELIVRAHLRSAVADVRGVGLLLGVEFTEPGLAGELLIELVEQGVVANHSLNSSRVLRLTPPAVLTEAELSFLYEAIDRACASVARHYSDISRG